MRTHSCTHTQVSALDTGVAEVVGALRRRAMLLDSLVLFLSDNGGPMQRESCNGGLRGGKGTPYEGGVRAPAFALWPSCLPPSRVDAPITMWDLYPTIVAAALAPLPASSRAGAAAHAVLAKLRMPHGEEESSGGDGTDEDKSTSKGAASLTDLDAALAGAEAAGSNGSAAEDDEAASVAATVDEDGAISWWDALAGLCEEDGCGVGHHRRRNNERRGGRRGSGRGLKARLIVLELSAATAGLLYRDYKLVATARRCLAAGVSNEPASDLPRTSPVPPPGARKASRD